MKILLLNDTSDLQNWGAQAGIDALKRNITEHNPDSRIESLTYKWVAEKFLLGPRLLGSPVVTGRNRLLNRFSKEFQFLPLVADEYDYLARQWLQGKGGPQAEEFLDKIKKIDFIVFNAEGSVYRNNFTAVKALFLLWFAETHFSVPGIFMNGTVHMTRTDPILPAMIGRTFDRLSGIAVREPYSLRNVKEFHPGIDVKLIPDSAFFFSQEDYCKDTSAAFEKTQRLLRGTPYFCLSLPILITKIRNYYRQPPEESALVRVVRGLKKFGLQAILMTKEPSGLFLEQVAKDTDSVFFGPEHSYHDLVAILKNASFLLSGRYHHIILASIVGCPIIPLASSSHKIHGLCELLEGVIGDPLDPTDLLRQEEKIFRKAESFVLEGDESQAALKSIAANLRQHSAELGDMLIRI